MRDQPKTRLLLPTDMLYLGTFVLGMLAFWISGHAGALLPPLVNPTLTTVVGLSVTAAIYGLIMLILAFVVFRRPKPALIATLVAVVLGVITAQLVVRLAAGLVHTRQDLAILTFVLYFLYGSIYMLSLAIGRKIAASPAGQAPTGPDSGNI
jgi:hypothetical protein